MRAPLRLCAAGRIVCRIVQRPKNHCAAMHGSCQHTPVQVMELPTPTMKSVKRSTWPEALSTISGVTAGHSTCSAWGPFVTVSPQCGDRMVLALHVSQTEAVI